MVLQRVVTAIILLALAVTIFAFTDPFLFSFLIGAVVLIAAFEWAGLAGLSSIKNKLHYVASILLVLAGLYFMFNMTPGATSINPVRVLTVLGLGVVFWVGVVLLIFGYPGNTLIWNEQSKIALMGVFALIPTWSGLVQLKYVDPSGVLLLCLIGIVSATDIGAFFVGRTWGDKKLAPELSPNKSWVGFWGGIAASLIVALILLFTGHMLNIGLSFFQSVILLLGSGLIAAMSVVGDLFVSMLKRNRNIKDSGKILPGHGGILDRCDSITAATPPGAILLMLVIVNRWAL